MYTELISNFMPFFLMVFLMIFIAVIFWLYTLGVKRFSIHEIIAIPIRTEPYIRIQKGGSAFLAYTKEGFSVLSTNTLSLCDLPCEGIKTKSMIPVRTSVDIVFHIDASDKVAMRSAFENFGNISSRKSNFEEKMRKKIEPIVVGIIREVISDSDIYSDLVMSDEPLIENANADKINNKLANDLKYFNREAYQQIREKFSETGLVVESLSLKSVDVIDENINDLINTNIQFMIERKILKTELVKMEEELNKKKKETATELELLGLDLVKQKTKINNNHVNMVEKMNKEFEVTQKQQEKEHSQKIQNMKHNSLVSEQEFNNKMNLLKQEMEEQIRIDSERLEKEHILIKSKLTNEIEIEKQTFEKDKLIRIEKIKSEIEANKEKFNENEQEEQQRTKLASFKIERIEAERDLHQKEEKSALDVILMKERSKIEARKTVSEIERGIALLDAKNNTLLAEQKSLIDREENNTKLELLKSKLTLETEKANAEMLTMNEASTLALLQILFKENPQVMENMLEKLLGEKGLSGVMEGLTAHLGNIESIRIADFGNNSNGNKNALDKLVDMPTDTLIKLITKLNGLGMGDLVTRFGIGEDSFDNLGSKSNNQIKTSDKSDIEEKNIA